ncbi:MAG: leucyl aminopeptidase [Isosphaeraceae bacterium]
MDIKLIRQAISEVQVQWLVLGIFDDDRDAPPEYLRGTALGGTLEQLANSKDLSGSLGELTPLYDVSGLAAHSVLLVGLGPRSRFDPGAAYTAGFAAAKRLAAKRRESVAVALPPAGDGAAVASALIEGAIVGTRGPGLRKTEANRHAFGSLGLVVEIDRPESEIEQLGTALRRAAIVGESVNLARDLVNTPPADKSPAKLADRIGVVAADAGIIVQTWDETRIQHERFGGLLGVAAGSAEPPRFLILDYRGGGESPWLALVGKGVTFDSGGLCLKPSSSMEAMKSDMTGAAVVVAAIQAVARLGLPVNVRGYVALTENMTGGKAMKLGDVLCMRNGKTVEVMNTDAEGRLILADALSFVAEQRPYRVLDLATLTGACMVALGPKVAGLFGNDDAFCADLQAACRKTGERVWRMPLDSDFKEQLKSSVADLKNIGGKWGGAITAAKFLEQFVDSAPWIHLDIAGPSWCDSENTTRDAGATGCFVRTLVALLEQAPETRG